jgi:hypothetical protein
MFCFIFFLGYNIIVTKLMARLGKLFTVPFNLTLAKFQHWYQLQNNILGICVCTICAEAVIGNIAPDPYLFLYFLQEYHF